MPRGIIDWYGEIVIRYNPSTGDPLMINGYYVLPCNTYGTIVSFKYESDKPKVVAAQCDTCQKAPYVDEECVCAECEFMPDGPDGRANWCKFHQEHPIIPTGHAGRGKL